MHPQMIDLYIKALHEEREREAEHARLVALVNRSRGQRLLAKKPRWPIRGLYLRKNRSRDEMPHKPTLEMKVSV